MAISNALLTLLKNSFKAVMGVTPKQFSSKSFLVNKGGNALNFLFDEFKQRILSYKKGTGLNVDMYQFMNSKEYQMAMGENLAKVYHTFKPDTFMKLAEEMKMWRDNYQTLDTYQQFIGGESSSRIEYREKWIKDTYDVYVWIDSYGKEHWYVDSPESEHNNLSDNDLKNQLQFGDEQDIQVLGKPQPIKNPRKVKAGKKALKTRMQRDEMFRKKVFHNRAMKGVATRKRNAWIKSLRNVII